MRAALLLLLLSACVLVQARVIQGLTTPPREDEILHLANGLAVFQALQAGDVTAVLTSAVFVPLGGAPPFYPPGLYLVSAGFHAALGPGRAAALLSQLPFLALLGASTWWLGRRLAGPWAGLAAAAMALGSPGVAYYTQHYYLDLPLAAAVAFNLAASLEARDFSSPRASLAWGASLALGAMAKNTFVFWGAFPFLALLAGSAVRDPRYTLRVLQACGLWLGGVLLANQARPSPAWAPLVYAAALPALAALTAWLHRSARPPRSLHLGLGLALALSLWNLENLTPLVAGGVTLVGEAQMTQFPPLDVKVAQAARILGREFLPVLPALLALSLVRLPFQDPARRAEVAFVAACGAAALVFNTAFVVTDLRYLLPSVVYLAVLAFLWLDALPASLGAPLAVAVAALPFLALPPDMEALRQRLLPAPFLKESPAGDYPDLEILREIGSTGSGPGQVLLGVAHSHDTVMQPRLFRYLALREGVRLEVLDPPYRDGAVDVDPRRLDRVTHLLVVGRPGEEEATLRLVSRLAGAGFRLLSRHPLPGGEAATLYLRGEGGPRGQTSRSWRTPSSRSS